MPRKPHTSKFQRYIEQGQDAVLSHPDYDQLEPSTTAQDTIASILHWAEEVWGEDDDGGKFDAESLLASAHRGYLGDFEDDIQPEHDAKRRLVLEISEAELRHYRQEGENDIGLIRDFGHVVED